MKDRIIRPFIFCEPTVIGPVYLDMLEQFVYPQVAAVQLSIIYQQAGAPPHWSMDVRGSINATFLIRWIGSDGPICWPSRSPYLTPLDFFLCICYSSEWYRRTTNPNPWRECYYNSWNVNKDIQEFEYRLDIVRATNGAHVEVYYSSVSKIKSMSFSWILCNFIALSSILSLLWLIEIREVWVEHRVLKTRWELLMTPTISVFCLLHCISRICERRVLRGEMGEISNFYNFTPRMLIFGTHMPPAVTMRAA